MTKLYDVAIVGGGPVGLSLALALSGAVSGMSIAVLDRRSLGGAADARASAISAGVRRVLVTIGAWHDMDAEAEPIRTMRITDSGRGDIARPLFLSFDGEVAPGEPFAHMVPNRVMTAALLAAIEGQVEVIAPAEITTFSGVGGHATLTLADGREIRATLVVAADGGNSALRGMAGIGVISHDYRQAGVVTTIAHELPHEGTAVEHFRPAGPFASLPLRGNRSSLVYTESLPEAARLKALSAESAAAAIEAAMGSSLGSVTLEEPIQSFPLKLQLARAMAGSRLALIGDAAHVIHPVAGQGLNLGLKDVAALTEVVVNAMRLGLDHGAADVLADYQAWRRLDTALMALVTDGMNRLFSNDIGAVRAIRDLGLGLVDRMPPIKSALIGAAAGVTRGGPRLLRGLAV